jgi:hypothetical protein
MYRHTEASVTVPNLNPHVKNVKIKSNLLLKISFFLLKRSWRTFKLQEKPPSITSFSSNPEISAIFVLSFFVFLDGIWIGRSVVEFRIRIRNSSRWASFLNKKCWEVIEIENFVHVHCKCTVIPYLYSSPGADSAKPDLQAGELPAPGLQHPRHAGVLQAATHGCLSADNSDSLRDRSVY